MKDELITRIKELVLEAYYDGFNQAHYSHMHPEICEPKECESAGKEYLAKKEKSVDVLKENDEKARIEGILIGLKICKEMWAQGTISHENIYENEVYYKEVLEKYNHN